MRTRFTSLLTFTIAALSLQSLKAAQLWPYRFDEIAEGVYLAVPEVPAPAAANIPLIISDQDAILVGTHLSPASAGVLIEQVKTLTGKPVRFVVNTHYHAPRPSAPREVFPPGVEVIGHELARRAILFDASGRAQPPAGVAPPTLGMTTRLALYRGDREIRTATRVDLTSHKKDFPAIAGRGVDPAAVKRLQTQIELEPPFQP